MSCVRSVFGALPNGFYGLDTVLVEAVLATPLPGFDQNRIWGALVMTARQRRPQGTGAAESRP